MSTVKSSPTRNPNAFKRDPTRHYVRVQRDTATYESPIDDYLGKLSPNDPDQDMYRVESEDRKVTGDRRLIMLSCSKEDHQAELAAHAEMAGVKQTRSSGSEGEETLHRGVLTP